MGVAKKICEIFLFVSAQFDWPMLARNLWRVSRREEQADRLDTILSPVLTGQLKGDQCSQGGTEEGKRLVPGAEPALGRGLRQWRESSLNGVSFGRVLRSGN